MSGPPPHIVKQSVIRSLARKYDLEVLVETGTFYGDMIYAMSHDFNRLYSIELDRRLYARAARRFAGAERIKIVHGDSAVELGRIVRSVNRPTLFWLDGHYSGGETAKGEKETPVIEELSSIFRGGMSRYVVVIDDARLFGEDPAYPTNEELRAFVGKAAPGASVEVVHDGIQIIPFGM